MNAEKQEYQEQVLMLQDPDVFNHVLETIATERIHYIYKKNEATLNRIYRSLYKALIGLVNNQYQMVHTNIILESMYSNPHQGPQERQNAHESDTFEPNKLPQPKEYIPKYIKVVPKKQRLTPIGSDDVTISEELEQEEDKSRPDATPGCNKLLTREKIIENEELSPEPFKAGEAELKPEKEKPEKEKSTSTDSPTRTNRIKNATIPLSNKNLK